MRRYAETIDMFGPRDTLTVERERIDHEKWTNEGTHCGACGQFCKVYRWKPYRQGGVELIALIKLWLEEDRFYHKREIRAESDGTLAKLRHWGLVVPEPGKDGRGTRRGWWKPTPFGIEFARGRARVPKYVYSFDDRIHPPPPNAPTIMIGITDILPESFDFESIWQTDFD